MCREERRIYFTSPELITALTLFCETSHQYFPFDDKAKVVYTLEPEFNAFISCPDNKHEDSEFAESEIAVALILLCKKKGIPVARRAEKSLEVDENEIVFVMKVSDEFMPA